MPASPPTTERTRPPVTDRWLGQYRTGIATTIVGLDTDGPRLDGVPLDSILDDAALLDGVPGYHPMDMASALIDEVFRLREVAERAGVPPKVVGRQRGDS